jgi:hypothetical protein
MQTFHFKWRIRNTPCSFATLLLISHYFAGKDLIELNDHLASSFGPGSSDIKILGNRKGSGDLVNYRGNEAEKTIEQ